jgi:hypothetical protein
MTTSVKSSEKKESVDDGSRRHVDKINQFLFFFVVFLNYVLASSWEIDTHQTSPPPSPFSCSSSSSSSSVMYKCTEALNGGMRVLWVPISES